jgi:hypothetical protein
MATSYLLQGYWRFSDEDITDDSSTSTSARAQVQVSSSVRASSTPIGPVTRARARELNYVILLKNGGPEASKMGQQEEVQGSALAP